MPLVRGLGDIKDWNTSVNFITRLNILPLWFPNGKYLEEKLFLVFLKLHKISNDSEYHFLYNFILNNDISADSGRRLLS